MPCKKTSGPCLSSRTARAVEGTSTALPCRPAAASAAALATGRVGCGNFFLVSGILSGVVMLGRFANLEIQPIWRLETFQLSDIDVVMHKK